MTTGQFFMIVIGIAGLLFAATVIALMLREQISLLRATRDMVRFLFESNKDSIRQRMSTPRETSLLPIPHEAPSGPPAELTSAKVDRGVQAGYFVPKGAPPECEPLVAAHYDGRHADKSIPDDSYILLGTSGKVIPGETFRQLYEPAAVGVVVDSRKPKTKSAPKKFQEVEVKPPSEEEKKLVEEYELPPAEAVEQEFATKKAPWTL